MLMIVIDRASRFDCGPTAVRLRSDCGPTAVRLRSDCGPIAVRSWSKNIETDERYDSIHLFLERPLEKLRSLNITLEYVVFHKMYNLISSDEN